MAAVNPKHEQAILIFHQRSVVVYGPLVKYQDGLLMFGIDCCHMSCSSYNSLMMNLVGRDGNHTNQIVATAFINTVTIDNY